MAGEVIEWSFSTPCLSERNHSNVLDRYTRLFVVFCWIDKCCRNVEIGTLKVNENKNVCVLETRRRIQKESLERSVLISSRSFDSIRILS